MRVASLILVGGLFTAACTFSANIDSPSEPITASYECMPLRVGVYYPPEFLAYTHRARAGRGPIKLKFPVGESSAEHFDHVIDAYFQDATRLGDRPSAGQPAGDLDAVLVLRLENLLLGNPAVYGWQGTWTTEITYRVQMLDPVGEPIASWAVTGLGQNTPGIDWLGLAGSNNAGESYSTALQDASRSFIQGFSGEPEVRRWLISKGINPRPTGCST